MTERSNLQLGRELLELGNTIKVVRKAQGLSLRQAARVAGISTAYLSKIELGQTNPSLRILHQLRESLKLPEMQFLQQPEHSLRRGEVLCSDFSAVFLFEEEVPLSNRMQLKTLENYSLKNFSQEDIEIKIDSTIDNASAFFEQDEKQVFDQAAKFLFLKISSEEVESKEYSEEELKAYIAERDFRKSLEVPLVTPGSGIVHVQIAKKQLVINPFCQTFFIRFPTITFELFTIIHPDNLNVSSRQPMQDVQELVSSPYISQYKSYGGYNNKLVSIAWAPNGQRPDHRLSGGG